MRSSEKKENYAPGIKPTRDIIVIAKTMIMKIKMMIRMAGTMNRLTGDDFLRSRGLSMTGFFKGDESFKQCQLDLVGKGNNPGKHVPGIS